MNKLSYKEKLSQLQKIVEAEQILEELDKKGAENWSHQEREMHRSASHAIFEYEDREVTEQLKIQYKGIGQGLTLAFSIAVLIFSILTLGII